MPRKGRPLTTAEAQRMGTRGAHTIHAAGKTNTNPATAASWQRFLDAVDPARLLPEVEREKRARHTRALHMEKLALASAEARRARKRSG